MKILLVLFGFIYVKNNTNGTYHNYKCPELNGIYNKKTCSKAYMEEDIIRHPYTVSVCNCINEIV